ncbi:glycoside hydrolase family 32 protein [Paenibacillus sp. FSL P4-0176]|uniref:glycoside hydrolase family 32 protein n=1 Tax=unclassified Paenibacillus TaxID=185978 RepID=UPI0003E29031|nr:glycoside hydrolase family 32 protein [Paenibacillus sp. FSL H7-689]ETT41909.1 glycoside hydrolase family protein [Paenibacillus sp. FSL H7-689]
MSTILKQDYRNEYHFSPKEKWMNDPNGMVFFNGEYHLFYQHHPHGTTWGPMHWGHAVSRDLISWEELPIALLPDENGTIFSGSAVVDWNNTSGFFEGEPGLVAIFTHHLEVKNQDAIQTQSLAYSKDNGRTWTKYEGNPVLKHESFVDFRDPKVFWHEQTKEWVMIIACGQTVCLYRSPNLKDWTLGSEFGEGIGSHDGVWECPDLFPLAVDGDSGQVKWVMLVSIGADPAFIEGSRTQYFTGDFDGSTFVPDEASHTVRWIDYGRDNYAGVSWSDVPEEDGRRLIIGWMSNWMYANQTPTNDYRGAMTIARELTLETRAGEVILIQRPARELEQARTPVLSLQDASIREVSEQLDALQLVNYEIHAEWTQDQTFHFALRSGADHETVVGVDLIRSEVYVDRSRSGIGNFHELFLSRHTAELKEVNGNQSLRIFVDHSSVEVFANDGQAVITDLIYPDADCQGISAHAENTDLVFSSLHIYEISSTKAKG